jgi:homoserine kinase type II
MAQTREQFGTEELAQALSHYDLGAVESIEPFPRGSRKAPKVVIEAERGKFLFKRRDKGSEDAPRVAFSHEIQLALATQNFPLPHLIGTREDNRSMLVLNGRIYELFEFVEGGDYNGTLDETYHAGRVLGLCHKLLEDFQSHFSPPTGGYHDSDAVRRAIERTPVTLGGQTHPDREALAGVVEILQETYRRCSEQADQLGLGGWDAQIVHGDWHPGNMLFAEKRVVAVIDYDAARRQQRVIDVANGALQFSILGGDEDPARWPDYVDLKRFERFLRGYDAVNVLSRRELQAVPPLMCEAVIAEGVPPVAATGRFGRMEGFAFLQMLARKVQWIRRHEPQLVEILED